MGMHIQRGQMSSANGKSLSCARWLGTCVARHVDGTTWGKMHGLDTHSIYIYVDNADNSLGVLSSSFSLSLFLSLCVSLVKNKEEIPLPFARTYICTFRLLSECVCSLQQCGFLLRSHVANAAFETLFITAIGIE